VAEAKCSFCAKMQKVRWFSAAGSPNVIGNKKGMYKVSQNEYQLMQPDLRDAMPHAQVTISLYTEWTLSVMN